MAWGIVNLIVAGLNIASQTLLGCFLGGVLLVFGLNDIFDAIKGRK